MPKQISQNELDAIAFVARFPNGISLGKIVESLNIPFSRRNIQNQQVFLVKKGLLHAEKRVEADCINFAIAIEIFQKDFESDLIHFCFKFNKNFQNSG